MEIDNKEIKNISIKDLIELSINLPNIQRIIDTTHMNDILDYQIEYLKKYKHFNFIGVLNINYCEEDKINYLVDGQHRYSVMKKLYDMGHDFNIFIEIITVKTVEELKENFDIINKNTQMPQLSEEINKDIPEQVATLFQQKYKNMWSVQSRANRPHLYFTYFIEALAILTEKLNIVKNFELEYIINSYNNNLLGWNKNNFPDSGSITDKMFKKAKDNKFMLGLFKQVSDEYRYKWVKDIIHQRTGEVILNNSKKRKKNIPQKLRLDIWNKYIGADARTGKCLCCRNTVIALENFQAGHIISEKNGGKVHIDNLRPICVGCNQSMGIQNMDEYIKEHYSEPVHELYDYWIF